MRLRLLQQDVAGGERGNTFLQCVAPAPARDAPAGVDRFARVIACIPANGSCCDSLGDALALRRVAEQLFHVAACAIGGERFVDRHIGPAQHVALPDGAQQTHAVREP